jgi:ComF family protein
MNMKMQSLLKALYPPQCLTCSTIVDDDHMLCGTCWRDVTYLGGPCCNSCGLPMLGVEDGVTLQCDDCLKIARPWSRGRSAILYKDTGRRLVMSLKHGDRTELARPAAKWMARAAPHYDRDTLIVPVPLHWRRLFKRRYNQAELLAKHVAAELGLDWSPNALIRFRATQSLDGQSRDARFATLSDAIRPHPKYGADLKARAVVVVDDVMTSGATLAACTEACRAAGAREVDVLTLARVAKDA